MKGAIPIQSTNGAHFGFVLLAGNETPQGECVFMPVPKDPESLTDPNFIFLRRLGAKESGEHKWKRNGDVVSIELTTGDSGVMNLVWESLIFNGSVHFRIKSK